jgi:hypothetical protein
MCDKCQTIFSELDLGWQSYEAATNTEDADGLPITARVRMDACPECAIQPPNRRQRRTRQLEREAGVTPTEPLGDPFSLGDEK